MLAHSGHPNHGGSFGGDQFKSPPIHVPRFTQSAPAFGANLKHPRPRYAYRMGEGGGSGVVPGPKKPSFAFMPRAHIREADLSALLLAASGNPLSAIQSVDSKYIPTWKEQNKTIKSPLLPLRSASPMSEEKANTRPQPHAYRSPGHRDAQLLHNADVEVAIDGENDSLILVAQLPRNRNGTFTVAGAPVHLYSIIAAPDFFTSIYGINAMLARRRRALIVRLLIGLFVLLGSVAIVAVFGPPSPITLTVGIFVIVVALGVCAFFATRHWKHTGVMLREAVRRENSRCFAPRNLRLRLMQRRSHRQPSQTVLGVLCSQTRAVEHHLLPVREQ